MFFSLALLLSTGCQFGPAKKTSQGFFWPASTIKIFPALYCAERGCSRQVNQWVRRSLSISDNRSHDRVVRSIGVCRLNRWIARRWPDTELWSSYGRRGVYPRRGCRPRVCRSVCTSLASLQSALGALWKTKRFRRSLKRGSLLGVGGKQGWVRGRQILFNEIGCGRWGVGFCPSLATYWTDRSRVRKILRSICRF